MRIFELFESQFNSSGSFNDYYTKLYIGQVKNFDSYVAHHGTDGANVIFNSYITNTKDELLNMIISKEPGYNKMIQAREALEEKIKNSGGLSY
jgi:hypothetical protein